MTLPITKSNDKWSYQPKVVYEITINPDDKHQFVNKKDTRVRNVIIPIDEVLKEADGVMYHMFPEVSEPQYGNTTTHRYARVHFHGIIYFKDWNSIRKWLLYTWHRLTSFASIQLNHYREEHWSTYCRKQQSMFMKKERIVSSSWKSITDKACPPLESTETS